MDAEADSDTKGARGIRCATGPGLRTGSSSALTRWDRSADPAPRRGMGAREALRASARDLFQTERGALPIRRLRRPRRPPPRPPPRPQEPHPQPDEAPQPHPGGRNGINRGPKRPPSSKSTRPPSLAIASGFPRQPRRRAGVSRARSAMPASKRRAGAQGRGLPCAAAAALRARLRSPARGAGEVSRRAPRVRVAGGGAWLRWGRGGFRR